MVIASYNLGAEYTQQGSVNSSVYVNEANQLFDMGACAQIVDLVTSVPPTLAQNGQSWIVAGDSAGVPATGEWAGHEGQIATFLNGWVYTSPWAGFTFYDPNQSGLAHVYVIGWTGTAGAARGTRKTWAVT